MQIKEIGGTVHYSEEMRVYLASLPRDEARRICAEIEYRNRPRKIIVRSDPIAVSLVHPSEEKQ